MRNLIPAILLSMLGTGLFAQTRVVKGRLTLFNRYPVENVEIAAKKAKTAVMTDSLGQFEIVCNDRDIIQVKGKVFVPMTRRVGKNDDFIGTNLIFRDSPENRQIATGMGYISEQNLTFALAHLESENNDFCNYPDVFALIKGKFPGVQVRGSGTDQGIFVRGQKSMTQDNRAIYMVDGVRVGDISWVNPCDMTSIDILKDGGAARYGSSAANGVVVIETRGNLQ